MGEEVVNESMMILWRFATDSVVIVWIVESPVKIVGNWRTSEGGSMSQSKVRGVPCNE